MIYYGNELYHHGIKGQKWGIRRFQNEDGSLTSAGRDRYGVAKENYKAAKKAYKDSKREYSKAFNKASSFSSTHMISQNFGRNKKKSDDLWNNAMDAARKNSEYEKAYKDAKNAFKNAKIEAKAERGDNKTKALKIGAAVAGTALAAYGAYKASEVIKSKAYEAAKNEGMEFAKNFYLDNIINYSNYDADINMYDGSTKKGFVFKNPRGKEVLSDTYVNDLSGIKDYKQAMSFEERHNNYVEDVRRELERAAINQGRSASENTATAIKYLHKNRKSKR